MQTDYGLAVTVSQDAVVDVHLAAPTPSADGMVGSKVSHPSGETATKPLAIGLGDHDSEPQSSKSLPASSSNRNPASELGYQYYIWPDYGTSFVWYESDWAGNPEGEDNVEDTDLEERYSTSWCAALKAWVERYTEAFEGQECHLGSGKDPFPDVEGQKAWVLDGMLLACWLALQPDVEALSFQAESDKYLLGTGGEGLGVEVALGGLLQDMELKWK